MYKVLWFSFISALNCDFKNVQIVLWCQKHLLLLLQRNETIFDLNISICFISWYIWRKNTKCIFNILVLFCPVTGTILILTRMLSYNNYFLQHWLILYPNNILLLTLYVVWWFLIYSFHKHILKTGKIRNTCFVCIT